MSQHQKQKIFSAVAKNLRAMRGGLSQAEFARFLGIPNQATYHRYESGRVPKAHILKQVASRLGITVDELLSPISYECAFDIIVRSVSNAAPSVMPTGKLTHAEAKSYGEASGELVNLESVKAVNKAFQIERLSNDELSRLFSHVVSVCNRAPVEIVKFYVLIRYCVGAEIARRRGIKFGFGLTDTATSENLPVNVKAQLPSLRDRLNHATKETGKMSALAEYLGVPLASVSRWLSGKREPGGEITLKLLHWVEQQERQK
jgi:transcriptional regulator with XRE-family HTH domain